MSSTNPPGTRHPTLVSWSGGKDCVLALYRLLHDPEIEVIGLIATVTTRYERVSIPRLRRELLHEQARALQLPLYEIEITPDSSNEEYEGAWERAFEELPTPFSTATQIAYGDIALEDVRTYRARLSLELGLTPLFPLWGEPTDEIAGEIIGHGFLTKIITIDTARMPAEFLGALYDKELLTALPAAVDPAGENGEFHTFVADGPIFGHRVRYELGETTIRDGHFAYIDLIPRTESRA